MKTGKKKPFPESILNKLNFLKNGFHDRRFPANVLKLLRKLRTTTSQQTFVLVKTYWRRLEDVFSVIFFYLPRRLEDVLKTYWRHFRKTYCKYVLKTCLQEVLEDEKCYAIDVLKTSWRRLGKQEMFGGFNHVLNAPL